MIILRRICRFGCSLWHEEDGPTAVEYAVMLALILAAVGGTVNALAVTLRGNLDNSADAIIQASN